MVSVISLNCSFNCGNLVSLVATFRQAFSASKAVSFANLAKDLYSSLACLVSTLGATAPPEAFFISSFICFCLASNSAAFLIRASYNGLDCCKLLAILAYTFFSLPAEDTPRLPLNSAICLVKAIT